MRLTHVFDACDRTVMIYYGDTWSRYSYQVIMNTNHKTTMDLVSLNVNCPAIKAFIFTFRLHIHVVCYWHFHDIDGYVCLYRVALGHYASPACLWDWEALHVQSILALAVWHQELLHLEIKEAEVFIKCCLLCVCGSLCSLLLAL